MRWWGTKYGSSSCICEKKVFDSDNNEIQITTLKVPRKDIRETEDEQVKDLPAKDAIKNKENGTRDVIVKERGGVEDAAEDMFGEVIEDCMKESDKEKEIRTEVRGKVFDEILNLIFKMIFL